MYYFHFIFWPFWWPSSITYGNLQWYPINNTHSEFRTCSILHRTLWTESFFFCYTNMQNTCQSKLVGNENVRIWINIFFEPSEFKVRKIEPKIFGVFFANIPIVSRVPLHWPLKTSCVRTGEIISEANLCFIFFFAFAYKKCVFARLETKEPDRHVTLRWVQTLINPENHTFDRWIRNQCSNLECWTVPHVKK